MIVVNEPRFHARPALLTIFEKRRKYIAPFCSTYDDPMVLAVNLLHKAGKRSGQTKQPLFSTVAEPLARVTQSSRSPNHHHKPVR